MSEVPQRKSVSPSKNDVQLLNMNTKRPVKILASLISRVMPNFLGVFITSASPIYLANGVRTSMQDIATILPKMHMEVAALCAGSQFLNINDRANCGVKKGKYQKPTPSRRTAIIEPDSLEVAKLVAAVACKKQSL
jgi:hypothetical protein